MQLMGSALLAIAWEAVIIETFGPKVADELGGETMDWRVVLEEDSETGDWAAWCPELPGCASCGQTEEEAVQSIKEAIALYLEPSDLQLDPGAKTVRVKVA